MDARKKFLAHKPTNRIQAFARAGRKPRSMDAATQTTALVNCGVASVAPRKTVPSQSEDSNQTEDFSTSP
jgi:hypothetical protein